MTKNAVQNKPCKIGKQIFLFLLFTGLGLYVLAAIFLYASQDSMLFGRPALNEERIALAKSTNPTVTDLVLRMTDGTTVRGWKVNADESNSKPIIFYYGGNVEEVSSRLALAQSFGDFEWILMNYRGYGASEGIPSEKALFSDAYEIYQIIRDDEDFKDRRVYLFGQSLGTGVALSVAAKYPVTKIILTTPYDSIDSLAQDQFPLFPVKLILKNHFRSIDIAPKIKSPTLVIAAENDTTIPTKHAQKLCRALGENCIYRVIPGVGHNDIVFSENYSKVIIDFLK